MSTPSKDAGPAAKDTEDRPQAAIDRRSFLASGAAVGAAAIAAMPRSRRRRRTRSVWDREVDVVVIGAGAGGLVAAIAAREKGASVLIVEKNFDIGGRAMMSFGGLYIGGGNRLQKANGVKDSPDLVFADWSRPEKPMGRFSDRELVRTYADNNLDLFDWLEKHGIKWEGYRGAPDRLDRTRTRLNVVPWPNEVTKPARGSGFVRPLAKTARQMGIEILLQHQMTKIHRENPLAGRVIGITAIEVDDWYKPKTRTMNIRARKGIVVATGGSAGNPVFRTMFDVRLTEEYQAENSEWTQRTADGEIAAMEIGAALGATACQTTQDDNLITKGRMGKKSNGTATELYPTAPHFFRARALGLVVKDYQNVILVKENGLRFYNETAPTRDYEYLRGRAGLDRRSQEDERRRPDLGDLRCRRGRAREVGGQAAPCRSRRLLLQRRHDRGTGGQDRQRIPVAADAGGGPAQDGRALQFLRRYRRRRRLQEAEADAQDRQAAVLRGLAHAGAARFATPASGSTPTARSSTCAAGIIPGLYACGDSAGGFGQHGICRAATFGRLAGFHAAAQQA